MLLHEFMVVHHAEILEICRKKLRDDVMGAAELLRDVELFFQELLYALRHHDGVAGAPAAPPGRSSSAARLGERPQRAGLPPAKVPGIFGAISHAIGQAGERHGLAINADEHDVFHQRIDAGVATSIENFWCCEKAQQERRVSERFGYLTHELEPVRIATVLRRLQASAIPGRAISITTELDESLFVNADEPQLTSAIGNLLRNAVKFSSPGGHVVMRCRSDDAGVVIEVEDECGGLVEAEPARLFRPYVKGAERSDNIGLGLAITKHAVEAMDGHVSVENRPGQGCTFSLTFPPARPSRTSSPPPSR